MLAPLNRKLFDQPLPRHAAHINSHSPETLLCQPTAGTRSSAARSVRRLRRSALWPRRSDRQWDQRNRHLQLCGGLGPRYRWGCRRAHGQRHRATAKNTKRLLDASPQTWTTDCDSPDPYPKKGVRHSCRLKCLRSSRVAAAPRPTRRLSLLRSWDTSCVVRTTTSLPAMRRRRLTTHSRARASRSSPSARSCGTWPSATARTVRAARPPTASPHSTSRPAAAHAMC